MSIFHPNASLDKVTDITVELLDSFEVSGLIIDIDNTLTFHNSQTISPPIKLWLKEMEASFDIILLSNNSLQRVTPFATMLGLDFIADGAKPLPKKGFAKAAKRLGKRPEQLAIIGDQLFTDVLGGNLFGATTIHVTPMHNEGGIFFGIKRFFENLVMRNYKHNKKG